MTDHTVEANSHGHSHIDMIDIVDGELSGLLSAQLKIEDEIEMKAAPNRHEAESANDAAPDDEKANVNVEIDVDVDVGNDEIKSVHSRGQSSSKNEERERVDNGNGQPAAEDETSRKNTKAAKAEVPVRRTRSSQSVTGLVLDDRYSMLHYPPQEQVFHCEVPSRVKVLNKEFMAKVQPKDERYRKKSGLRLVLPHEATDEELLLCHTQTHLDKVKGFQLHSQSNRVNVNLDAAEPSPFLPCDSYFCNTSLTAARLAAGGVIDLGRLIAMGEVSNGFAVVRPPGHHAERDMANQDAWGFCFFNNVAVAASVLKKEYDLKIMIIDWDIHHCNGTQDIFYSDDTLVVSIHRYSEHFFPETGSIEEVGAEKAKGYNVNIGWDVDACRDMRNGDYLAAWNQVIVPIATDYQPDLVIISCGFDAARDDPVGRDGLTRDLGRDIGGLTGEFFGNLTTMAMDLPGCGGKVMLVLEGGYVTDGNHGVLKSATACLNALRGERKEFSGTPTKSAQAILDRVVEAQREYWSLPIQKSGSKVKTESESEPKEGESEEVLDREIERLEFRSEYGEYAHFGGFSTMC